MLFSLSLKWPRGRCGSVELDSVLLKIQEHPVAQATAVARATKLIPDASLAMRKLSL